MMIEYWGIEWHLTYAATILKSRIFLLRSTTIKTNFLFNVMFFRPKNETSKNVKVIEVLILIYFFILLF